MQGAVAAPTDFRLIAAIVDALEAVVVVLDPWARIVWLNRAAAQATGHATDALLDRVIWDVLIPPEDVEPVKAVFRDLRDGTAPTPTHSHENNWLTRDGGRRLIRWSNSVVRDERGRTRYVVGTGIDVTGRRRAERELRDSDSLFRALFEQAAVGIAQVGVDGRWLRFNDALCRIVGYSRDELARKSFQDITHADDLEVDLDQARQLRDGHIDTYTREKRYLRPGGAVVWAQHTGSAVRDEAGRARYFVAVVEDITRRVDAVRALRESEARTRAVVETAPDGIITIDERGTIESLNPAAFRMFGYAPDEIVGRNVSELMPEPFRTEHDEYLRRYIQTGKARVIGRGREVLARRRDGTTFACDLAVGDVRLGDRRLFTGILRDATDRKRTEELHAAKEAADAANRAKDELLAVVAHDLRAPLSTIRIGAGILKRHGGDDDARRDAVAMIEESIDWQRRLLEDLLDASRMASGGLKIETRPLDLADAVRSAADTARPTAEEAGLRLELDTPAEPIPVVADPARLRQVLGNLLSNASKFTPRGGRVHVNARLDGHVARVEVADTGRGISTESLERVFDRYWQADPRGARGLGLGLAIVRHLVELHGGTVRAESDGPGQGATFSFTLPLAAG